MGRITINPRKLVKTGRLDIRYRGSDRDNLFIVFAQLTGKYKSVNFIYRT